VCVCVCVCVSRLQESTSHFVARCCIVLQSVAVCSKGSFAKETLLRRKANNVSVRASLTNCNRLQQTAPHCETLQNTSAHSFAEEYFQKSLFNILQHIATLCGTYCNTLQHTATHCYTLWHILQHTATHCNTLQHIATLCGTLQKQSTLLRKRLFNTLQHTVTYCTTLHHPCLRKSQFNTL